MPKDTAKLKKHIALMCERLNKGAKLDLSGQMQSDLNYKPENRKQLETLDESQEDMEDTTGLFLFFIIKFPIRLLKYVSFQNS